MFNWLLAAESSGLWSELAEQVPALVVLCVLVYWFLSHLREERMFLKTLEEQNREFQSKVNNDNTELLKEVSAALGSAMTVIERMEKKIDG